MTYINGIKASKADLERLAKDLENGGEVEIKTTKKGNTAITTKFWKGQKMKVKTISTQTKDENGQPLYFTQDLDKLCKTESERAQYMQFLENNQKAGLLKYEIIAE